MQLIRQDYVDETKVSYKDLTYEAMRGMLSTLDPHSQFMDPKDFKNMQEDTKSEFGGLGVVVSQKNGVLTVISPMEDSPGFEAGILPGDQILKINGQTAEKLTLQQAVDKLRGEVGKGFSDDPAARPPRRSRTTNCTLRRHQGSKRQGRTDLSPQAGCRIGYGGSPSSMSPPPPSFPKPSTSWKSRAWMRSSSTCAAIRAACSTARSMSPANFCRRTPWSHSPAAAHRPGNTGTQPHGSHERKYPLAVLVNYASASGSEIGRRRLEGPWPRAARRRNHVRQGLCAECHLTARRFRSPPNHGKVFHAWKISSTNTA